MPTSRLYALQTVLKILIETRDFGQLCESALSQCHTFKPRSVLGTQGNTMNEDAMASRIHRFKGLLPELEASLKSFQASQTKFRVLKTVRPGDLSPADPSKPNTDESPKTLFILDSSFNPPSIAHLTLAKSVLEQRYVAKSQPPHRLLLLFAVMNADKAPSAASFPHRLAMMTLFAQDLLSGITETTHQAMSVDVGITKAPYYTDKSAAIEADGSEWYPNSPRHVHLIGFDTVTRFFNPKYYRDSHDPPLSALEPYFSSGHALRVTLRPDDEYGSESEQRAFVERLENGDMESDGGRSEWASRVELVEPVEAASVSSTKIRKAAKAGDWNAVDGLCTVSVAAWVKAMELYTDDDRGAKMA